MNYGPKGLEQVLYMLIDQSEGKEVTYTPSSLEEAIEVLACMNMVINYLACNIAAAGGEPVALVMIAIASDLLIELDKI